MLTIWTNKIRMKIFFSQDGLLAHPQGSLHKQSLRGECAETICQNYQLSTSKSMFTFVDLHLQGDLPVSWRLNGLHFLSGHQDGADHVQASPIDIFANLSPRLHGFLIFFILHQLHSVGYSDELAGLACTIVIIVGALGTVLFGVLAQVQWRPHQLIELTFFFTFRRLAKLWRSPSCAVWELLFACSSSPTCCSCPTWASTSWSPAPSSASSLSASSPSLLSSQLKPPSLVIRWWW